MEKTGGGKEVDNSELDVDSGAKPVENSEMEGNSKVPSNAKPPQVPKGKKRKKKAIRDKINIAAKGIENGKWRDKYRAQPNKQEGPPLGTISQPQAIGGSRRPLKRQGAMVFDEDGETTALSTITRICKQAHSPFFIPTTPSHF
jgi:hypothetical protein